MEVTVTIKRLDLIRMNFLLAPKLKANWITLAMLWVVSLTTYFFLRGMPSYFDAFIFVAIFTIFMTVLFFPLFLLFCVMLQAFFANERSGLGIHLYRVQTEGLYEESPVNITLFKWRGIERVWRFKNYTFVQVSLTTFHILPKRDFESEQAFDAFSEQIEKHMA